MQAHADDRKSKLNNQCQNLAANKHADVLPCPPANISIVCKILGSQGADQPLQCVQVFELHQQQYIQYDGPPDMTFEFTGALLNTIASQLWNLLTPMLFSL